MRLRTNHLVDEQNGFLQPHAWLLTGMRMAERPILFSAPIAARFDALVSPEPNSGCWLWMGSTNTKGYGRFGGELAHRVSVRLAGNHVPTGMEVDHLCKVRCCVNPDHLEIVTHAENISRKTYPTSCPHGHARFSKRSGGRACLECDRLRNKSYYRERNPVERRRGRRWLTVDEKAHVMLLIASGQSHAQIAAALGISVATVSRVRNSNA